jgi:hypothetical protein
LHFGSGEHTFKYCFESLAHLTTLSVEVEGITEPDDESHVEGAEKSGEDGDIGPGEVDQMDRDSLRVTFLTLQGF